MRISFDDDDNRRLVEELATRIKGGEKVYFLVGSAASLAPPSCMPSAGSLKVGVLQPLVDKLPARLQAMIIGPEGTLTDAWQALPLEVVFQQMRRVLGEDALDPLEVFGTQRGDKWFNLNHVALAALAGQFQLPVLTTNWDLLIEQAALHLGFSPDPVILGAGRPAPRHWAQGRSDY